MRNVCMKFALSDWQGWVSKNWGRGSQRFPYYLWVLLSDLQVSSVSVIFNFDGHLTSSLVASWFACSRLKLSHESRQHWILELSQITFWVLVRHTAEKMRIMWVFRNEQTLVVSRALKLLFNFYLLGDFPVMIWTFLSDDFPRH